MKRLRLFPTFICAILLGLFFYQSNAYAKEKPLYTITPSSKPCDNSAKYHTYNKKTKNYYTIMSYMHKFEKSGGGTLVLKKGTYTITNTIYVPSNVTIRMKSGVKLVKGTKTNVKDMPPSSTMFQLIRPSKSSKSKIYGAYQGEKNIRFLGEGDVAIDMKGFQKGSTASISIIMGHNRNVQISGISFRNIKLGHFIEMDASKQILISDCSFANLKNSGKYNKEAINLDTPDPVTGGFSQKWSKQDKTPNQAVTIKNCRFSDLERAVGTHRYSKNKYHTDITFTRNHVDNVQTPLGMLNWRNVTVTQNTFQNCKSNSRYDYIIFAAGNKNVTFTDNDFKQCSGKELFKIYEHYQTAQKEYPATASSWTSKEIEALTQNRIHDCNPASFQFNNKSYALSSP